MDIAMVGGFGLALAAGIVFLFIDRLNRSEMDDSRKRLITYATFAAFAGLAVLIFRYHSMSWIASNG